MTITVRICKSNILWYNEHEIKTKEVWRTAITMKKILSLILILALALFTLAGCKSETPKEVLVKASEKAITLKTMTTDMTVSLSAVASDAMIATDPESASVFDMINGIKLTGTMAQDVDTSKADMKMQLTFNGMTIDFSMLMDGPQKILLQSPLLEKMVLLTPETDAEPMVIDKEKIKALNTEMTTYVTTFLTDEEITMEKNVAYTGKGGDAKIKMLTINLTSDRVYEFINGIIPVVYGNEYLKEIMKPSIQAQLEMQGMEVTDEAIAEELDKLPAMLQDALVQSKEVINFSSMVIKMGVDKDYNTVNSAVTLGMTATNPDATEETVTFTIDYLLDSYAFDQPVVVELPELTDDNTMSMEDFMMELMIGMMGVMGQ